MTLSAPGPQITYAIVRSVTDSSIRLDNLRVGPASSVASDATGAYALPHLPPGAYRVQALPASDWVVADPVTGIREVTVDAQGDMVWPTDAPRPSDFAGRPSPTAPPWRNPMIVWDVSDDTMLTPIDALLVINQLNRYGSHTLLPPSGGSTPPPYVDVTGDNFLSPMDALRVINELNRRSGGGSGESSLGGGGSSGGGGQDGLGEGEAGASSREREPRLASGRGARAWAETGPQGGVSHDPLVGFETHRLASSALEDTLTLVAPDVTRRVGR